MSLPTSTHFAWSRHNLSTRSWILWAITFKLSQTNNICLFVGVFVCFTSSFNSLGHSVFIRWISLFEPYCLPQKRTNIPSYDDTMTWYQISMVSSIIIHFRQYMCSVVWGVFCSLVGGWCMYVCLFCFVSFRFSFILSFFSKCSFPMETHLSPDGIRLKQNARARP